MEKLNTYLKKAGLKQGEFAKVVGLSQTHVSFFCNGVRKPNLEAAIKIEDATKGKVPCRSWIEEAPAKSD